MKRICVFCGASPGRDPRYVEAARALGRELVERGLELVYGGGSVGLMGQVADAVLAAGGRVTGVIPEVLQIRELAHRGLTDLRVVASMHERKALMAELSDGFVALPGGMGTLEELAEVLTWAQLGLHQRPVGLLDVAGYYAPLIAFFDQAEAAGFLRAEHRRLLLVGRQPGALLETLRAFRPDGPVERLIDRATS
ncbi:MAG: TIGR00730 family Rossman fold protein [Anaeromyxobacter sp.]|nr:TIGR00730 family Rossman fold protein [Anaeromyxobacter sp.]MBL0275947.1 TIGR00730 family Rossman fold protein [Anaeromyxobacter sp.]